MGDRYVKTDENKKILYADAILWQNNGKCTKSSEIRIY